MLIVHSITYQLAWLYGFMAFNTCIYESICIHINLQAVFDETSQEKNNQLREAAKANVEKFLFTSM
jgi:hypothetical protein